LSTANSGDNRHRQKASLPFVVARRSQRGSYGGLYFHLVKTLCASIPFDDFHIPPKT